MNNDYFPNLLSYDYCMGMEVHCIYHISDCRKVNCRNCRNAADMVQKLRKGGIIKVGIMTYCHYATIGGIIDLVEEYLTSNFVASI